jgi:AcrR family transcriptional regulator
MHTSTEQITASAERVFDSNGFAASGMDTLTRAAGVSTRTLYKHVGGKSDLITAVLRSRSIRFFEQLAVDDVDGLFAALEQWVRSEGARGCLFLRAAGELSAEFPAALEEVATYRRRLRALVHRLVHQEGDHPDDQLADQILVLFEGATSAASYRGIPAIAAARSAAAMLMRHT